MRKTTIDLFLAVSQEICAQCTDDCSIEKKFHCYAAFLKYASAKTDHDDFWRNDPLENIRSCFTTQQVKLPDCSK